MRNCCFACETAVFRAKLLVLRPKLLFSSETAVLAWEVDSPLRSDEHGWGWMNEIGIGCTRLGSDERNCCFASGIAVLCPILMFLILRLMERPEIVTLTPTRPIPEYRHWKRPEIEDSDVKNSPSWAVLHAIWILGFECFFMLPRRIWLRLLGVICCGRLAKIAVSSPKLLFWLLMLLSCKAAWVLRLFHVAKADLVGSWLCMPFVPSLSPG